MKKKRNPQDSTLRNIQARNKMLKKLERRVQILEKKFKGLVSSIISLLEQ